MQQPTYKLKQNNKVLELEIPSTKYRFRTPAYIFAVLLYLVIVILSTVVIIIDFSISALLIGGFLIAYSLYSIRAYYLTSIWVKRGTENLIIDKNKNSFYYYKLDLKKFDEQKAELNQLSAFRWSLENDEYTDVHPRDGLKGGRICFWIKDKKVRFGISMSKEDARKCIMELNTFMTKKI